MTHETDAEPTNAEVLKAVQDLNRHLGYYHETVIQDNLMFRLVNQDVAARLERLERKEGIS